MPSRPPRLALLCLESRIVPVVRVGLPVGGVPVNEILAVGAGPGGGPHVKVFNLDGTERFELFAYDARFRGGVRVATGDVTGDGIADLITGAGPSGGPHVRVFDGRDGHLVGEFFAFGADYTGGVYVGAGDVDGDGIKDVIVSGAPGPVPAAEVRVFHANGAPINSAIGRFNPYFGYYGAAVAGGVTVAALDLDGDRRDDIVVGAPSSAVTAAGGQGIKVFNARNALPMAAVTATTTSGPATGRVYVSTGDATGDHVADIVYSVGFLGRDGNLAGSSVQVLSGVGLAQVQSYDPYPRFAGASTVVVKDFDRDGTGDLVTGAGFTGEPIVLGRRTRDLGYTVTLRVFDNFLGGVFVG